MNRSFAKSCAGMMAMVLLLGGCGSSGGADLTETVGISSPAAESAAETETSSAAETAENTTEAVVTAEETTEAAAAAESTTEPATAEKETTEAPAEDTTEETSETASVEETAAETEAPAETIAAEGTASLDEIYSQITQQVSLNSPMTVPAEFIANYFGIDVSAAEDYLFVMSEMATSAETIVIVKAGGADKQALTDSLQAVIDQKAAEMENYLPDQYDIVSRSAVQQTGDYVWLVISENADAIRTIIEAGLQ